MPRKARRSITGRRRRQQQRASAQNRQNARQQPQLQEIEQAGPVLAAINELRQLQLNNAPVDQSGIQIPEVITNTSAYLYVIISYHS